jgi:hypothetical protein
MIVVLSNLFTKLSISSSRSILQFLSKDD